MVHRPGVPRAPVPVEDVFAARVPLPFDRMPDTIDGGAELRVASEIPARTQQASDQARGLDQVAAIVLRREGNRLAAAAMQKMREHSMEALGAFEMIDDLRDACAHVS